MTVSELGQRMSAYEETAWAKLYEISPFGDYRADVRSAQIAQLIYSANAPKQSRKKTLTDFMPFFRKRVTVDPDVNSNVRAFFGNLVDKNRNG